MLPIVLRAKASQISLPQVRSTLMAFKTLSNRWGSDFSFNMMPVAMYPVHFSENLPALMRFKDSSWPKSTSYPRMYESGRS